jgi:hypothetical protein
MSIRFLQHPKCGRLCKELGVDKWGALGIMQALWDTVAADPQLSENGVFAGWSPEDIAWAIDWKDDPQRLVDAILNCRLFDKVGESFAIHDWLDYCPEFVKSRKRMRDMRQKAKRADDGEGKHGAVPNSSERLRTVRLTEPDRNRTEPDRDHNPTETEPKAPNGARRAPHGNNGSASGSAAQGDSERHSANGFCKALVSGLTSIWPLEFAESQERGRRNANTFRSHMRKIFERDGVEDAKTAGSWILQQARAKEAASKCGELNSPIAALNTAVMDAYKLRPEPEESAVS